MKILNLIKGYSELLIESDSFRDRLIILSYILTAPFKRLFNINTNINFHRPITLRHSGVRLYCGKSTSYASIARKNFEREVLDALDINSGTFIDIGSHLGKYAVIIGKRLENNGEVLAIEPEKRNVGLIKKNISLNKLKNVILEPVACFNKNKMTKLYLDINFDKGSANSSLIKCEGKIPIEVPSRTLDFLVKKNRLANIKLVKIDVEGAETEVLKGGMKTIKKYRPKIIFETWGNKSLEKVKKLLSKYGYLFKKIGAQDYLAEVK